MSYVAEELRERLKHCPGCGKPLPRLSPADSSPIPVADAEASRASLHLELGDGLLPLEKTPEKPRGSSSPANKARPPGTLPPPGSSPLRDAINELSRSLAAKDPPAQPTIGLEEEGPDDSADAGEEPSALDHPPRPRRRKRKPQGPSVKDILGPGLAVAVALAVMTLVAIVAPIAAWFLITAGLVSLLLSVAWLHRLLLMDNLVSRLLCYGVPGYAVFHLFHNRARSMLPAVLYVGSFLFLISGGVIHAKLGGVGPPPIITPQTRALVANSQALDSLCTKMLRADKMEAMQWLQEGENHQLVGYSHREAVALIDALYRYQAAQTYVAGIRNANNGQTASMLIIELLPVYTNHRRYLFNWYNASVAKKDENLKIVDDDQKFILLQLEEKTAGTRQ
jgi:hypothetical protein